MSLLPSWLTGTQSAELNFSDVDLPPEAAAGRRRAAGGHRRPPEAAAGGRARLTVRTSVPSHPRTKAYGLGVVLG